MYYTLSIPLCEEVDYQALDKPKSIKVQTLWLRLKYFICIQSTLQLHCHILSCLESYYQKRNQAIRYQKEEKEKKKLGY